MNVYLNELSMDVSHSDDWAMSFDNAISCLKVLSKVDMPIGSISTIIHQQNFFDYRYSTKYQIYRLVEP